MDHGRGRLGAACSPHLYWLTQHDYAPFSYAVGVHDKSPYLAGAKSVLGYLAGSLGYVAVPIVVVLLMARPDARHARRMAGRKSRTAGWRRRRSGRRSCCRCLAALAFGVEITSLWSMSAFALLPVLLLSSPAVSVRPLDTERILIAAVAFPLIMLIASPFIAIADQRKGPPPASAQAALLAARIEHDWHALTPQPLRYVGGPADLAYGVAAYAADRPLSLPDLPQPSVARSRKTAWCSCVSRKTKVPQRGRRAGHPHWRAPYTRIHADAHIFRHQGPAATLRRYGGAAAALTRRSRA